MAPTTQNGMQGLGFAYNEVNCMLELIEKYLSIGPSEWDFRDAVEPADHSKSYAEQLQESLKQKFVSLHIQKTLTGDRTCA
jgi:hypothetical protein